MERAVRHVSNDPAAFRAQNPSPFQPLGDGPGRYLAGGPVGQYPVGPIRLVGGKGAAKFDRIPAEESEDVLVDDGELLDHVVNADRLLFQSEVLAKPRIGDGGDPRRPVSAEVDRDTIRLPVIHSRQDPLPGIHGSTPIMPAIYRPPPRAVN